MTQKDKELLLQDLCARLPYGIKFLRKSWNYEWDQELSVIEVLEDIDKDGYINNTKVYSVEDIKPYLFPLSSMTDEQKREFYKFFEEGITESANETRQWLRTKRADETMRPITIAYVMVHELVIEWLNKNHFDYRGLIKKGLAIDATNLNVY